MLDEYLKTLTNKRVAVIGAGVSNTPLIELLSGEKISLSVHDKREKSALPESLVTRIEECGGRLVCGEHYLDGLSADVIFRSPGVRPDAPAIIKAVRDGAEITSEMDLFFRLCPCRIIAVTGSDGKTTTSTLISELLKAQGFRVFLGGNIGTPLLTKVPEMTKNDRAVIELSSFQLFDMTRSPHSAVITNVTPNHLDWHRDMEEYKLAKFNILAHQSENSLAVLNGDDETTRAFGEKCPAGARFFSLESTDAFAHLADGDIYIDGKKLMAAGDIKIPGMHNAANFLAACAAVYPHVSFENMAQVARTFSGVPHRIEFVRESGGARYFNDSIASSPTRTIAGLKCFGGRIILIAGGYDKHIAFDGLGDEICSRVSSLILCGATSDKIEKAVMDSSVPAKPDILRTDTLAQAVLAAHDMVKRGDTVLFSPACASFDQFPNFAVRGDTFKELVRAL